MHPSTDDSAPISVLHEDLLFNIFMENTFLDDFHQAVVPKGGTGALTTARRCSQVSQHWRSTYLSSPSIWGRLINLDDLLQGTEDWRKEVIARTGEALLWVYGGVSKWETADFVFSFLRKNWARVQLLLIVDRDIYNTTTPLADGKAKWAFLNEPAPQLQKIYINGMSPSKAEEYLPPARNLFNSSAPLLKHFSIPGIIPQISWSRHLSSLSFQSSNLTTEKFLKELQDMPELVFLGIYGNCISNPNRERCPQVILPKLRTLSLGTEGSFLNVGPILQCITPSPDCCLYAPLRIVRPSGIDSGEYERYETGLASFILPYLSLHPPTAVELACLCTNFVLLQSGRKFAITFSVLLPPLSPSPLLKELISSVTFSNVSTVCVLNASSWSTSPLNFTVLEAFPSATTLITTDDAIQTLLRLGRDRISTLLPALSTLEVRNMSYPTGGRDMEESPHEQFLKLRKDLGLPLSVLNLGFILNNLPVDLNHFECEHPGLLVKWSLDCQSMFGNYTNFEEYRCGDGHPETSLC
ncbi:hypothetical protein D9613_010848 [Agrocybe pediades]|uniref:F-box domain-containing protein n=1 Tax=Agrocybe pediades TaxID=84607 RepID=A0A8H4VM50_9AGAR|nr:hypothetical protein D9613_010848 [Agrocybe pediades]